MQLGSELIAPLPGAGGAAAGGAAGCGAGGCGAGCGRAGRKGGPHAAAGLGRRAGCAGAVPGAPANPRHACMRRVCAAWLLCMCWLCGCEAWAQQAFCLVPD